MKKLFILFLIALLPISTAGCDPTSGKYPFEMNECWYCQELDMMLDYREDTLAQKTAFNQSISTFTWNGETIDATVGYMANGFIIDPVVTRPDSQYNSAINGQWNYDGDNIIFEVTSDEIFHGVLVGMKFVFVLVE